MKRLLISMALAAAFVAPALSADLPVKAPVLAMPSCTLQACSGFYVGGSIIGAGANIDSLAGGLNSPAFGAGGMLGAVAGWQLWNGQLFAAVEAGGYYDVTSSLKAAGASSKFLGYQVIKVGYGMSGLLGSPGTTSPSQAPIPVNINPALAAAMISPYAQVGAVERSWGTGWGVGAGAEFIVASGWNLDLSYLRVSYGNGAAINPGQVEKTEDLVKMSLVRKF